MKHLPLFAALVSLLALAACDSSGDTFDVDDYTGIYRGTGSTTFSNGSTDVTNTAPMVVTVAKGTGNTVSVSFDAGPANPGDDDPGPIVVPGTYSDTGARFALADGTNSVVITVDDSGSIDGSGNLDFFGTVVTLSPGGRISGGTLNLDIAVVVVSSTGDVPAGSRGSIKVNATR